MTQVLTIRRNRRIAPKQDYEKAPFGMPLLLVVTDEKLRVRSLTLF
jgi:hypothetical protein